MLVQRESSIASPRQGAFLSKATTWGPVTTARAITDGHLFQVFSPAAWTRCRRGDGWPGTCRRDKSTPWLWPLLTAQPERGACWSLTTPCCPAICPDWSGRDLLVRAAPAPRCPCCCPATPHTRSVDLVLLAVGVSRSALAVVAGLRSAGEPEVHPTPTWGAALGGSIRPVLPSPCVERHSLSAQSVAINSWLAMLVHQDRNRPITRGHSRNQRSHRASPSTATPGSDLSPTGRDARTATPRQHCVPGVARFVVDG